MKENRWMQVLLAAVVIVIAGSLIALAETVDVEVEVDEKAATTVEIRTDDSIDVFTLDNLADGEERIIESGEHTITVRRDGDEITVLMDGEALDAGMPGHGPKIRKMIMMGEPGEGEEKKIIMVGGHHGHKFLDCDTDGEGVKIIKIRKGEGGEDFVWHGEGDSDFEEILIEMDEVIGEGELAEIKLILEGGIEGHEMIFFGDDEGADLHKIISMGGHHGAHFGKVRYRCEETGSMLLVDPEHATQDTLIDPASGCVMTKVADEQPQVIVIKKEIRIIDED